MKLDAMLFKQRRMPIHEKRMKALGFTESQINEAFSIANFILESFMANGIKPEQVAIEALRITLEDTEEYRKWREN